MNIQMQGNKLFSGSGNIFQNNGLKSTQEKMQKQAERDNQIAFLENQKNNLKKMKCDSLEKISLKLDLFHSYEDEIAAVKESYNNSQVMHALDEARERGEQIAKAAEKYAPKTPEERHDEMVEEALGLDESKDELSEALDELTEVTEEMAEELTEEMAKELTEVTEELSKVEEETLEDTSGQLSELTQNVSIEDELNIIYRKIDVII